MTYLPEIEQQMKKVLQTLQNNRSLLKYPKTSGFEDTTINVENLEDVAGNHLFDDHPKAFGLSEIDGHKIRAYFQEGCVNYNFVADLHEKFKDILESERHEYLNRVNKIRAKKGLEPISININMGDKMSKENNMIEIFANPDGRIAYKVISTGKIFELEPTKTRVVGPEGYINITEGMWMTIPVGGGEAWVVDILASIRRNA